MLHPDHPWIDSTHAPVYVFAYPHHDPNDPEQVKRYTAEHTSVFEILKKWTPARCTPFAFITDLTHLQVSTALSRRRATEYLTQSRRRANPFSVCRAFVGSGEAHRILTAVFWQAPPEYPYIIVPSRPEAVAWAQAQMRAAATG